MKNYFFLVLLVLSYSCQAQTKTTAAKKTATATSTKEPSIVGNWKMTNLEFIKTAEEVDAKTQQQFIAKAKKVGSVEFKPDFTYKSIMVEDTQSGIWKYNNDTHTMYVQITGVGADTLTVQELTADKLKGQIKSHEANTVGVEYKRTK